MAFTKVHTDTILPVPEVELTPGDSESKIAALIKYALELNSTLRAKFSDMVNAINDLVDGNMTVVKVQVSYAAPVGPQDGWIAYADGTIWNPGAGRGLYGYSSGAWHKIV